MKRYLVRRLLEKAKKDLQKLKWLGVDKIEGCVIQVKQRDKKYCCCFNSVYMFFTSDSFEGLKPTENKEVEKILKRILNGGCSRAKYRHKVDLQELERCEAKYKIDKKTLYSFKFNFELEEMFLNPIFLSDCLKYASTNVIYFNSKWSPVVFKNSGEELKRFGIIFPVKKNL